MMKLTKFMDAEKIRFVKAEPKTLEALLPRWLKDDAEAISFILTIHQIIELWDDLIDEENVTDELVNAAFYAALITLPRNAFYQRNFVLLNPLVESAIFDWWTANTFEQKQDTESLRTSYILRCAGLSLTVMSARIVGGVQWALTVNNELRSLGDTWAEYAAKHKVT